MSAANPLPDTTTRARDDEEANGPASEPSRPTDPRHRPPPLRDALSTLDEEAFDFHDTIPAPPWLDELDEFVDGSDPAPLPAR